MTAIAPYRSAVGPGRDGFAQLVHAEWTKFRTVRGWVIGMLVAVLVTAGIGLFAAAGQSSCQATSGAAGAAAQSTGACSSFYTTGPGGEPVSDSFYFVRQPLAGNGSLTVQVASLTGLLPTADFSQVQNSADTRPGLLPWSKAGIIIKDGTSPGSAYVAMLVTGGNGVRMQWNFTGDAAGLAGPVAAASPRWLRLTRAGDAITGYDSPDGVHWTRVGTVDLSGLLATAQAGLFATSPQYQVQSLSFGGGVNGSGAPTQDTAVFDHISKTGAWAVGSWTGDNVGGSGQQASGAGGYHRAAGRFTVTGSGDIAPVAAGAGGTAGPGTTITTFLVGTFAGLIAVIVVAAMFITAEYRRGLIRVTLAASPHRGRVLVAKSLVLGVVAFVAGLAGAAGGVLAGTALARSHGSAIFPASGLTELRVIVGTAALIALAAVLAFSVGSMLRRSAATVTLLIVVIVLPYFLATTAVLPAGVANWVLRITPAAAFAVQQAAPAYHQVAALYTPGTGFYPLAPWAGLAVLCGWTALALGLAGYLLRRRDA
jgi:ABC-type transport system involved in multi-copper enzyme maturation permease subunit